MEKQRNNWKVAGIILIFISVILLINSIIQFEASQYKVDLNKFEISEENYISFVNLAQQNNLDQLIITDIETNQSVVLKKQIYPQMEVKEK